MLRHKSRVSIDKTCLETRSMILHLTLDGNVIPSARKEAPADAHVRPWQATRRWPTSTAARRRGEASCWDDGPGPAGSRGRDMAAGGNRGARSAAGLRHQRLLRRRRGDLLVPSLLLLVDPVLKPHNRRAPPHHVTRDPPTTAAASATQDDSGACWCPTVTLVVPTIGVATCPEVRLS